MKKDTKANATETKVEKSNVIVIELPRTRTGETFEYKVKENEKHLAHVYQEQVRFNPDTGARLSKGQTQIYDKQGWENFRTGGQNLGYTIVPLHIPEGWESEVQARTMVGGKAR